MSELLPYLLCKMRCKWRKQDCDRLQSFFIDSAFFLCDLDKLVVVLHKSGDNGIQTEALQTHGDICYHSVTLFDHLFCCLYFIFFAVHQQIPQTFQEAVDTVDSTVIPLCIQLRRSHEQFIHSQRVTSVVAYQIIRRYDISFGLTHLDSVLSCDHSLVEQLVEWFIKVYNSDVMQEFCIETRVQKMQYRMLYTTDIHIYRKHLVRFFSGNQFFVIVTVHITQEVPRRTSPLRHGICLTFCVFSTNRTLAVYPLFDSGKR